MKAYDRGMSLPLRDVSITGPFWARILDSVRNVMIPYQWEALNDHVEGAEKSHCLMNLRIAAGEAEGEFGGLVFQDSDVAKWLEAVGYTLETHPDPQLEQRADEAIDLIVKAQREDGYINTYFILAEPEKRWTNLLECHELYCAGHLIEAAVAYYYGTGKRKFLDAMCRYADLIDLVFGPEPGKLKGYPGHPEIELALVKLYKATDEERYLRLAKYFVDERGRQPLYFDLEWERRGRISHWTKSVTEKPNRAYNQIDYREYNQFHLPVREQARATGHAVRAIYLYTGMADAGRVAIQRGPLVYCFEQVDNGPNLASILLPHDAHLRAAPDPDMFGGIVTVAGEAIRKDDPTWSDTLYRFTEPARSKARIKAIPYFLWGNRSAGEMQVWIRKE